VLRRAPPRRLRGAATCRPATSSSRCRRPVVATGQQPSMDADRCRGRSGQHLGAEEDGVVAEELAGPHRGGGGGRHPREAERRELPLERSGGLPQHCASRPPEAARRASRPPGGSPPQRRGGRGGRRRAQGGLDPAGRRRRKRRPQSYCKLGEAAPPLAVLFSPSSGWRRRLQSWRRSCLGELEREGGREAYHHFTSPLVFAFECSKCLHCGTEGVVTNQAFFQNFCQRFVEANQTTATLILPNLSYQPNITFLP
jgi:hypothetical protein